LQWKMLIYFMDTWSIFRSFVIFYGHFMEIWCIFSRFGILYEEKSGNPALKVTRLQMFSELNWDKMTLHA
jgi:hypothetical protein